MPQPTANDSLLLRPPSFAPNITLVPSLLLKREYEDVNVQGTAADDFSSAPHQYPASRSSTHSSSLISAESYLDHDPGIRPLTYASRLFDAITFEKVSFRAGKDTGSKKSRDDGARGRGDLLSPDRVLGHDMESDHVPLRTRLKREDDR